MSAPITVALLGGGTVGSQVARLLLEQSDDLAARIGAPLELVGVAVRDASTCINANSGDTTSVRCGSNTADS